MASYSRRKFLGTVGCASLGSLPFLSTWLSLTKLNAAATTPINTDGGEDYRALVCILLAGGNDSYNMLVPRGQNEYAAYAATRSNLALPQTQLLPLSTQLQTGLQLGIHPAMPEVEQLYQNGKLAFLANVGTLIEPVAKSALDTPGTRLPLGLFSHSDQIQHWQTSVPQSRAAIGWGGKLADLLSSANENPNISMNISLSGNNVFQAGKQTIEYTVSPDFGAPAIEGYQEDGLFNQVRTAAIDNLLEQEYQNIFQRTYSNTIRNGKAANEQFIQALDNVPNTQTTFSPSNFSRSLAMIARTIAARKTLGMKRQVFFVEYGGWDHHDEVINAHNAMLGVVSRGLSEFQTELDSLGVADCVTTFNISDFARTLSSNGNGSDHGWGGNVFVMGGAVNGGEVYGKYPTLALNSELEIGGGVLIPTTSTDEYFAELALWMGVSPTDLPTVLPNLGNFFSVSNSSDRPIGFMQ